MLQPVPSVPPQSRMRRTSATKFHTANSFPAPTKGVDSRQSLANSDPQTATVIENFICRSYGLELRAGYGRHGTLPSGTYGETLMPYNSARGAADSKLFIAAEDGWIYDATAPGPALPSVNVTGQTNPGEAYWVNFVVEGGNYLCVVLPGAGYWTYETTAGWVNHPAGTSAGQIDGIDPKTFGYVWTWGNRLWFAQVGTGTAWYLETLALAGKATTFEFGPMFIYGGELSVGASWTVDTGGGLFDKMVLVGSEGDVLVYAGTDPTDMTTFKVDGRWFVGRVPIGRRFLTRFGANMALLTERGLLLMSDILRGTDTEPENEAAARINQLLQPDIRASLDKRYWEIKLLTDVNVLYINAPAKEFVSDYSWVIDLTAFGASKMTNQPFITVELFKSQSFACDLDGNVWMLWSAASDGQVGDVRGTDIEGRVQTAFVPLGDPFRWKRFLMARAGFRSTEAPAVQLALNSEWAFTPPGLSPIYNPVSNALWDVALWDAAVWGGEASTYMAWVGVTGMGHYAALMMVVKAAPKTVFTNWDCVTEAGGIL